MAAMGNAVMFQLFEYFIQNGKCFARYFLTRMGWLWICVSLLISMLNNFFEFRAGINFAYHFLFVLSYFTLLRLLDDIAELQTDLQLGKVRVISQMNFANLTGIVSVLFILVATLIPSKISYQNLHNTAFIACVFLPLCIQSSNSTLYAVRSSLRQLKYPVITWLSLSNYPSQIQWKWLSVCFLALYLIGIIVN
jgi:hypothetical protein